jgi:uncharacterized protein
LSLAGGLLPPEWVPFQGQGLWVFLAVAAAQFVGFFIRGAFGFGSNMPIVLLTAWLLSPHHAIVLVMLTATVAQVHLLPQGLRTADWQVVRTVAPGFLTGIAIGTWIFTELKAEWLLLVMAVLIAAIVLLDRLRLIERLSAYLPLRSAWTASGLALAGATVGTICGGGTIYFLVVYFKLVCRSAAALRATNITVSGLFVLLRVAGIAATGFVEWRYLVEALLLLPAVFLGTWAGTRIFHATPPERFYAALQVLLLLAALSLAGKGVLAVL